MQIDYRLLVFTLIAIFLFGCDSVPTKAMAQEPPMVATPAPTITPTPTPQPVAKKQWPKDYDAITRFTVSVASKALFISECKNENACVNAAIECSKKINPTETGALKETDDCVREAKETQPNERKEK